MWAVIRTQIWNWQYLEFRNDTGDVIYAIYELGRYDYGTFTTEDATTADGTSYTQIFASENKTYGYYFNEDLTSGILVNADGQAYDALTLDETVARDLAQTIQHWQIKTGKLLARINHLCPGKDLNLHTFRHTHLKRTCIPISPPGH